MRFPVHRSTFAFRSAQWGALLVLGHAVLAEGIIAKKMVPVDVCSAEPSALTLHDHQPVSIARTNQVVAIGNGFLTANISVPRGLVESVTNHVTGESYTLAKDEIAATVLRGNEKIDWNSADGPTFDLKMTNATAKNQLVLEAKLRDLTLRIVYSLKPKEFWLERRFSIDGLRDDTIERISYGSAEVAGASSRVLQLGRFDQPRLIALKAGGLFAGVGSWFSKVSGDGIYFNDSMSWKQSGTLDAEPWYLGVFANETREPYNGWTWYKCYLERARLAVEKHTAWFSWNAGWGQWGIDINDSSAGPYLDLLAQLGIDGVIFGSGGTGKGIDAYSDLAASNRVAQENLAVLKRTHIAGGTLNSGQRKWDDANEQPKLMAELERYVAAGYGTTAFDFFSTPDTYIAHRNVAAYFRAAHDKLSYTECHLGMAKYGPQFQRLVQVNHPDDIAGFDIGHFSADWATFLAFRQSRRNWQKKYEYLMPENGLYYYLTHYSNWGNPRRYTDPEPQQFLWKVPAYCGIGFNFHDVYGWRESIAAASAFTTCPVFGHLDLKMPPRDIAYAKHFFAWIKENAGLLQTARVCQETESHCVVSKIVGGKGLIYVINYLPGMQTFELSLCTGFDGPLSIRQVYPSLESAAHYRDGAMLTANVRGESCCIFEVNGTLKSLPPQNAGRFPIDLDDWRQEQDVWIANVTLPDVRDALKGATDPNLPKRLLSLDQVQDSRPELLTPVSKDGKSEWTSAVKWIGKGKLPPAYLKLYGFGGDDTVETSKIVPWAFADRVWLVYRREKPLPMAGAHPTLTFNGRVVEFAPRVDHRYKQVEQWTCPLFVADVTEAVRFGDENEVHLAGVDAPPSVYITTAADRN